MKILYLSLLLASCPDPVQKERLRTWHYGRCMQELELRSYDEPQEVKQFCNLEIVLNGTIKNNFMEAYMRHRK